MTALYRNSSIKIITAFTLLLFVLVGGLSSYFIFVQAVSPTSTTNRSLLAMPAPPVNPSVIATTTIHQLSLRNGWHNQSAGSTVDQAKEAVESVVFAAEGQTIISGSADGVARIWKAGSGELVHTFAETPGGIDSVALSPDGGLLAVGTSRLLLANQWDDSVYVWSLPDNAPTATLGGPRDQIAGCGIYRNNVVFSPDGTLLAAPGYDHTVRVWRVADGTPLFTLEGHLLSVLSVAFSPDGSLLASASEDGTVNLWRTANGSLLYTLPDHLGGATTVAFSPDGRQLVSGDATGLLKLWSAADGEFIQTFEDKKNVISNLAFSLNGDLLVAGSTDNAIHFWTVSDGKLVRKLDHQTGRINSVAFSQDGRLMATGAEDGALQLWHITD